MIAQAGAREADEHYQQDQQEQKHDQRQPLAQTLDAQHDHEDSRSRNAKATLSSAHQRSLGSTPSTLCASSAPIAQQARELAQTAMDVSGLSAGVTETAARLCSRAASSEAALLSGGGGI